MPDTPLRTTRPDEPRPDPDAPFRGQVRCRGFQRVSHGLYRQEKDSASPDEAFRRELESWLLVLPPHARFTHLTAARLRRWHLPKLPEGVPVFAAVSGTERRPRRPGLVCSRLVTTPAQPVLVDGLPVDETAEILLRAARDLGHLDLRVLVEGAMRAGDLDDDQMRELLESGRPGVRNLRAAYVAASRRTESPGETLLLVFHEVLGIPVEVQRDLTDEAGTFVARADLYLPGTPYLHEYDGEVHRSRRQHAGDLRRDRRLGDAGYVRKGFTLDDLLNHALVVMHEIDRALGRPHRRAQHHRWQRMVEHSLYSDVGRERLLNRWHRETGVVDWAKTA